VLRPSQVESALSWHSGPIANEPTPTMRWPGRDIRRRHPIRPPWPQWGTRFDPAGRRRSPQPGRGGRRCRVRSDSRSPAVHEIESVEGIYQHREALLQVAKHYLGDAW